MNDPRSLHHTGTNKGCTKWSWIAERLPGEGSHYAIKAKWSSMERSTSQDSVCDVDTDSVADILYT